MQIATIQGMKNTFSRIGVFLVVAAFAFLTLAILNPPVEKTLQSTPTTPAPAPDLPLAPALETVTTENFSFDDYKDKANAFMALDLALKKLLPAGTPEEDVDALLVTRAGAVKSLFSEGPRTGLPDQARPAQDSHHTVQYVYETGTPDCFQEWRITARFDEENRVIDTATLLSPPCMKKSGGTP